MATDKPVQNSSSPTQDERTLAVVSYLWIISIFLLLTKKDSAFVQFHAKQGFVLAVLITILGFLAVIGWLINCVLIIIALYAMTQAWAGKRWEIPYLGKWAQKISF